MHRRWRSRLFAAVVGCVLLTGCPAQPEQTEPQSSSEASEKTGEQQYFVQSSTPQTKWSIGEYPAADASSVLAEASASTATQATQTTQQEVRAVWFSYLEMANLLTGQSEAAFTANIASAFEQVKALGLNTVIVQVRPFGDALYPSKVFPWSHVVAGTEGEDPGFDPLAIMVSQAQANGLQIEAWINPYRVRAAGSDNELCSDNPAAQWLEQGGSNLLSYDGAIHYDPASETARELILQGVEEIVHSYAVDGIHIDDYFYPSTDQALDSESYSAYTAGGGTLALEDWRRSNVQTLLRTMQQTIKAADPDCRFGISPQSSLENNYNKQYLDVQAVVSEGLCDYLCPQIYFGYENSTQPYTQTLNQWNELVQGTSVELYVGLAAYKVGTEDAWAGGGAREWQQNTDLLSRMVQDARQLCAYAGFALYRYDSIFSPVAAVMAQVEQETEQLKEILTAST